MPNVERKTFMHINVKQVYVFTHMCIFGNSQHCSKPFFIADGKMKFTRLIHLPFGPTPPPCPGLNFKVVELAKLVKLVKLVKIAKLSY